MDACDARVMSPRYRAIVSIVVFAGALFVYLTTTNQIFSFDAITNAIACERQEPIRWFHPNHPLYPSLGVLYYQLERLLGYEGLAIYSLARLNSLLMASALAFLFYGLSGKARTMPALVSVFFLGSCYSMWHFAVDGRAVGASAACAALLIVNLLSLDHGNPLRRSQVVTVSFLSLLYILMHGMAFFHILAIALWLALFRKRASLSRVPNDWGSAVLYLSLVSAGLLLSYGTIFIWVIRPETTQSFLRWAIGYASYETSHMPRYPGFWSTSALGGLQGLWAGWKGSFIAHPSGAAAGLFSMVIPVMFLALLGQALWKRRQTWIQHESLIVALVLWGMLCESFVVLWSPAQVGFHLHALIPWTVALLLLLCRSKVFLYGQAMVASAIFLWNLTGPIAHASTITHNQGYMALKELRARLQPGDTFVAAQAGAVPDIGVLMPYFFPELSGGSLEGLLFAFRETSLERFETALWRDIRRGRRVYVLDDFFDSNAQLALEAKYALPVGSLRQMWSGFRLTKAFQLTNGRVVYEAASKVKS